MDLKKQAASATAHGAWLPNLLTSLRLVGAVALLFVPPAEGAFYLIYAACGLSDVLDGFLARRLHTASPFGAKLDSVADLSFYTVLLVRLLPHLRRRLPVWIWYLVGLILFVRLTAYACAAVRLRKFAAIHTIANKATGLAVFGVPAMLPLPGFTAYCVLVCAIGLFSSAQELVIHLRAH